MHMLMNVTFPCEPFNTAVRDGSIGEKLQAILKSNQPEVVYFTEQDGCRGAVLAVEVSEASAIPKLAEPWFLTLNAVVKFRVAMSPDELAEAGLDSIAKNW